MAFTVNQWAILALVLILGWVFGMLSRSGGGKWRRAYDEERSARLASEARIEAANRRILELERHAPPVGAATGASIAAAARGGSDDLTLIRGIDRNEEVRINDAGIFSFKGIATMSTSEEAALEGRLGYEPGRIAREDWRDQATLLAKGRTEEHRQRFG